MEALVVDERTSTGALDELPRGASSFPPSLLAEIASDPLVCAAPRAKRRAAALPSAHGATRFARTWCLVITLLLSDPDARDAPRRAGALVLDEAHHVERVAPSSSASRWAYQRFPEAGGTHRRENRHPPRREALAPARPRRRRVERSRWRSPRIPPVSRTRPPPAPTRALASRRRRFRAALGDLDLARLSLRPRRPPRLARSLSRSLETVADAAAREGGGAPCGGLEALDEVRARSLA